MTHCRLLRAISLGSAVFLLSGSLAGLEAQIRVIPKRIRQEDVLESLRKKVQGAGFQVLPNRGGLADPQRNESGEYWCSHCQVPLVEISNEFPSFRVYYCGVDGSFWWETIKRDKNNMPILEGPDRVDRLWRYSRLRQAIFEHINTLGNAPEEGGKNSSLGVRARGSREALLAMGPMITPYLEGASRSGGGPESRLYRDRLKALLEEVWKGRSFVLRDFQNQVFEKVVGDPEDGLSVIMLWSRWSDPSIRGLEDLVRLKKEFDSRGVRFVALCEGDEFEQIWQLTNSMNVDFPVYYNVSGRKKHAILGAFSAVPITWIFGPGKSKIRLDGRRDTVEIRGLLEDRLGGS
ncbi:MAG: hypothetical protein QF752_06555 [Planctomycetota bacterium]|nr:hypothetical protein [Planctomycetota bacterium]